jgi:hypothetical protein
VHTWNVLVLVGESNYIEGFGSTFAFVSNQFCILCVGKTTIVALSHGELPTVPGQCIVYRAALYSNLGKFHSFSVS